MTPGSPVERTDYDLSDRERELMPMRGHVVSVENGVAVVQWSHRTRGKTNRYYVAGQRVRVA